MQYQIHLDIKSKYRKLRTRYAEQVARYLCRFVWVLRHRLYSAEPQLRALELTDSLEVPLQEAAVMEKLLGDARLRVVLRRSPMARVRVIFSPEPELKAQQKGVMLSLLPLPQHLRAFGFIRGKSAKLCPQAHLTYWGVADPAQLVLLNIDIEDFFPSITAELIAKALSAHGVEEDRIKYILSLCTIQPDRELIKSILEGVLHFVQRYHPFPPGDNSLHFLEQGIRQINGFLQTHEKSEASQVLCRFLCAELLGLRHLSKDSPFLPQGSPASPILSNLVMKIADYRLAGAATSYDAFYTRYADDLVFSWNDRQKGKVIDGLARLVEKIIGDYGLRINRRKKEVKGTGVRQDIVGYCINSGKLTVTKEYRAKVRAELHNAQKSQQVVSYSRLTKLQGKIAYIGTAHPELAQKMMEQLRIIGKRVSTRNLDSPLGEIEIEPQTELRELGGV